MTNEPRKLDPFDAAVLVCVSASGAFGLLIAAIVRAQIADFLLPVWPILLALSAIGWITIDRWSPRHASRWRQLAGLAVFVCIEALAAAPIAAIGWEVAGARAVLGAGLATGATFAGLVVFALVKPTSDVEPTDPLVILALITTALVVAGVGLGLPLGIVWAAPLIGITSVFVLSEIANVAVHTGRGEATTGGTRLFACVGVLFGEFLYYFVSMADAQDSLWGPFRTFVGDIATWIG